MSPNGGVGWAKPTQVENPSCTRAACGIQLRVGFRVSESVWVDPGTISGRGLGIGVVCGSVCGLWAEI